MARLTDHERACRALSERDFQWAYVKVLRHLGFKIAHHYDSRFSDPGTRGFPDLTIVGFGRLWFEELKREVKSELSEDQIFWHQELTEAGQTVFTYRPSDWELMLRRVSIVAGREIPPELAEFPRPRKRKR